MEIEAQEETYLKRLKKLAQSATPGPWNNSGDHIHFIRGKDTEWNEVCSIRTLTIEDGNFIAAMNPSTALRMIELLERAAGYIQNAELKECVNCPENSPTPIEECMQCQTVRAAYKWLKDLEEL